jgi:glycosyltransferase involved in cell wall biosynthesis
MAVPALPEHVPFVTVAIGTYKRARWLKETLAFIQTQEYPLDRWELIVVDNNSPDNTREVVESFAGARKAPKYFFEGKQGSSHARNRCLAEKDPRCEIIIFTDDDMLGETDWLWRMVEPLTRPGSEQCAGVCGEMTPHYPDGMPPWMKGQFQPFRYRPDAGLLQPHQIPSTANVSLRRSVLDQVGGFRIDLGRLPNRLTAGEDNDLMRRIVSAGYHFWYDPVADLKHVIPENRTTFKYACKLQYDSAHSRVIERCGRKRYLGWVFSRILLNLINIPLAVLIGLLSCLVFQAGPGTRWFTRSVRSAGYFWESLRVLKRKLCGQPVDVYS